MTFAEYLAEVSRYKIDNDVRMGQAYYNCLPETLANKYVNTILDPYYDDGRIGGFLNAVYQDFEIHGGSV